jgi:hypothetical protein
MHHILKENYVMSYETVTGLSLYLIDFNSFPNLKLLTIVRQFRYTCAVPHTWKYIASLFHITTGWGLAVF